MTLLIALLAINSAFGLYLFISLRSSPDGFWSKLDFRSRSKARVTRSHQFYDAFADRSHQLARSRSNTSQY